MKFDDELEFARDEYDAEEKTSENLLKVSQFHLTVATLIAGASLTIAKGTALRGRVDVFILGFFFVLVWVHVVQSALQIRRALAAQAWDLAPPLCDFRAWRGQRHEELTAVLGYSSHQADNIADGETLDAMKESYTAAVSQNRLTNATRQSSLTESMNHLIIAALYLGFLAVVYCGHIGMETADGKRQPANATTTATAANASASAAANPAGQSP